MAQTSGNRDEPSMEDILSSIRKIIQSNEDKDGASSDEQAREQNAAPAAEAPVVINDVTPVQEATGGDVSQLQASAEKLEPKLVVKPVEQSTAQEKTVSPQQIKVSRSADMAASESVPTSVNAEVQSERGELTGAPARTPQAAVQITEVETPVEEAPEAVAETPVVDETPAPIAAAEPVAPVPMPKAEPVSALAGQVVASAQEVGVGQVVADLEEKLNSPKAEEIAGQKEIRSSVPALLSSDSGAKVAASFAELTQNLEGLTDKNLEGMASDMLRPMLQEWLDDNLPSLVERLVREEIERVARGG